MPIAEFCRSHRQPGQKLGCQRYLFNNSSLNSNNSFLFREQIATFNPSLAKATAVARPMPFVEPVMRAFFMMTYYIFFVKCSLLQRQGNEPPGFYLLVVKLKGTKLRKLR
jgi:hypothetical protein